MRPHVVRSIALFAILVLTSVSARATCGGGGGGGTGGMMPSGGMSMPQPRAYVVPWKILQSGTSLPPAPMVLYWFPATADEVQGHELLASRVLTIASSQCIEMAVVPHTNAEMVAKWEVADKRPTAVLVSDGKALASVAAEKGRLRAAGVERMVQGALRDRENALEALLDDAKKKTDAGEKDAAVSVYQQVWEQRCVAPKKGRAAQKALAKLGVTVKDARLDSGDPILTSEMNERITSIMDRGLAEEVADRYERARDLYVEATKLDPADPVPARFLGELYRHHTGEWDLAKKTFGRILDQMYADPLSRAVALHGIGKMTIHMGSAEKGLALFEESIGVFPLPLTYRNLAVYWNSERIRENKKEYRDKAESYVQKAMALDPHDPFNLIFAATYMADSGRREEALRIARENEHILAASYNLAAIHALLGNKGKAMELLRRHFFEYERYDAVRAMEMWEARVDYVFEPIKNDPDFQELTAMAR